MRKLTKRKEQRRVTEKPFLSLAVLHQNVNPVNFKYSVLEGKEEMSNYGRGLGTSGVNSNYDIRIL